VSHKKRATLFLTCVSLTALVRAIGWTSVRPSVRLSVRHTLVLCWNGSTYRQAVITPWVRPWTIAVNIIWMERGLNAGQTHTNINLSSTVYEI